jgi:hypothetical protein
MKVKVTGEQRAVAVLKAFDKDVFKGIDKGLKQAGEVLRDEVRSKTPSSGPISGWGGWNATRTTRAGVSSTKDLSYNATKVRTGIKVTTKQGKKVAAGGKFQTAVATMSPAGAMYALAGSKKKRYKREPSYRGRSFVDNINNRSGEKYARGMYEAMKNKAVVAKAKEKVTEVIREAERQANRILGGRR